MSAMICNADGSLENNVHKIFDHHKSHRYTMREPEIN